jgi:predicted GTPase
MQEDPQEILDKKLCDPETVLTPSQSITLLNHCAELGEQSAATAAGQTVSMFLGNTGTGKSTTLNALLGCRMRAEFNDETDEETIIVDPSSPREEVMPIGHSSRSQTFMPQIAQDPDNPNSAYCDCPGFSDNRGAEINIANAINTKRVLQQAAGVKAVFLTEYSDLIGNRGNNVHAMENMCKKMFGGADNLRRYQNSVLLGITKAPLYNRRGQPVSINSVRSRLTQNNTPIAQILANRIFLFDPLDRAMDNPDFWPIERCRTEIAQLEYIPQQQAVHLFQTTLTDSDKVHLLTTVRQLQPPIISAIEQGDVTNLGQHWQLLQRLRVVEHPEVHQIIEGQVFPAVNIAILQKAEEIKDSTSVLDFDDAQRKLSVLTDIISHLPGVPLLCNVNELRRHVHNCQANKDNEEAFKEHMEAMMKEMLESRRLLNLLMEKLNRIRNWEGFSFSDILQGASEILRRVFL